MKNLRFLLIFLPGLLASAVLFGQKEILHIRGMLKDEETMKKLDGIQIIVFQNGNQFDVVETGSSGKMDIKLPLGYSYDLKFSRPEYVSKILRFDTRNIPPEDRAGGFQIDIDMKLFRMIEGFNSDIMKDPIGIASFVGQENNILFDFKYTERQQAKIKAEFDRLQKLSENGDKLKKEFDKLMSEGTQRMNDSKYQDAMTKFEGALKIFPKDETAKKKYDEAKAKYDEQMAAEKREADYKRLIAEGDNQFKGKNWNESKKAYQEASNLKKDEKYPKERIYEINKFLEQEAVRAEYNAVIKEADVKFNNKDYQASIDKYKEAQKILPQETYPKDQIAKAQAAIDLMMADESKRQQIQKRYDDMVALGNKNLGDKKYDAALSNFQEAERLKADEKYPKEKIAEIEKILRDLKAKSDAEAATASNAEKERIEREYNQHILAGDKFFQDSREKSIPMLQSARNEYQQAQSIKPSEKYPAAKIKAIGDLIAKLELEESAARAESAKNADRLSQEERLRLEREAMAKQAEEKRLAALAEEERKRKEREDALAADREARRRRGSFLKADDSEEQAVDAYYREARRIEEDAKYKAVEDKKEMYAQANAAQESRAMDKRRESLDNINSQKDKMRSIQREGETAQGESEASLKAMQEQHTGNVNQYRQSADMRNERAVKEAEEQKKSQSDLTANDRYRQNRVEKQQRQQDEYKETQALNQSKGDTRVASNTAAVERKKEAVSEMATDGEKVRQLNIREAEQKKEAAESQQRDVKSAADVRLGSAASKAESDKQNHQAFSADRSPGTEKQIMQVNEQKQNATRTQIEKQEIATERQRSAREELFLKESGREKRDDEYKPTAENEGLPEGVTETTYEFSKPNRKIIERKVKSGNRVITYQKVVSKTGVFYFKDNRSITEEIWIRETLRAE